jgi:hypothetical protein
MKLAELLTAAVCALAVTPPTHAAIITWGAASNISGDTDVSTDGTLVGAFNIGAPGVANTTVNGVLFTGLALTGNNVTSGDFNLATAGAFGFGASNGLGSGAAPFSTLSAPYQTLLESGATSFTAGLILTMIGLTPGNAYEFEWWSNASGGTASVLTTATAGNSVTLATSPSGGNGEVGQFAIGTFTADSTSQVITFNGPVQDILSAFQLRTSTVPEPTTIALLGLAFLGVMASRRRR